MTEAREYQSIKLDFTDSEWMSIIDKNRDGLGVCCGNISTVRDHLISAARNGGEVEMFEVDHVRRALGAAIDGHDLQDLPLMARVISAFVKAGKAPEHVPDDLHEFLR